MFQLIKVGSFVAQALVYDDHVRFIKDGELIKLEKWEVEIL